MICLRAASRALYGELRLVEDMHGAAPGELLITPPCLCERCIENSLKGRAFVGSQSGRFTTIARVCDEPDEDVFGEFHDSPLARRLWLDARMYHSAQHLITIADGCREHRTGRIVRLRVADACCWVYPAEQLNESAESVSHVEVNQDDSALPSREDLS